MNKEETNFLKEIKQDFFSFRNGFIADALRKSYPEGKMIFGLMVPQFLQLAKKYPKDITLGLQLWNDKSSRESSLFALYIIPPEELEKSSAETMIKEVYSYELAEFLSFKILKNLAYAKELLDEISKYSDNLSPYSRYCISMLQKNLNQS